MTFVEAVERGEQAARRDRRVGLANLRDEILRLRRSPVEHEAEIARTEAAFDRLLEREAEDPGPAT